MIAAALKDEAFLADLVEVAPNNDCLNLWWLGQSGYLIHHRGNWLLLDPYLSDSLTRKYASTDKPHVRMTEQVIGPEMLGRATVVTASHHHTDHLDPETLRPLVQANPSITLVCPAAHCKLAHERSGLHGEQIIGLSEGLEIESGGFHIAAVPAAHEALDRDQNGHLLYLGFVVKAGPWTIYHSGDTVLYPGMEDLLRPMGIDVALLPINGRAPERRVAGNLTGLEAAKLASAIGAQWVIPCHYDMFEFNTASPGDFEAECRRLGQAYSVLRAGERWTLGQPCC